MSLPNSGSCTFARAARSFSTSNGMGSLRVMAELGLLHFEIVAVVLVGPAPMRHTPRDGDARLLQPRALVGIVGHERDGLYAEIAQHGRRDLVASQIGREAELLVSLDGVGAFGLQRVRLDLVAEADAAPFLSQIHNHAAPRLLDGGERAIELLAAVALERAERLAGPALGVHARQHRLAAGERAERAGD